MSSIEEDIKVLENLIVTLPNFHLGGSDNISRVLQDYTRQKQINEEHQKINGELREKVKELEKENKLILNSKIGVDLSYDDYVPKQKIKDKIEEIKEDRESKYYDNFLEERDIEKTVQVLQELLQEEEK